MEYKILKVPVADIDSDVLDEHTFTLASVK